MTNSFFSVRLGERQPETPDNDEWVFAHEFADDMQLTESESERLLEEALQLELDRMKRKIQMEAIKARLDQITKK